MIHTGIDDFQTPPSQTLTRVSQYDNWSATLTAGVIVLTVVVAILFGIWLSSVASDREAYTRTFGVTDLSDSELQHSDSDLAFFDPGFSELPEANSPEMKQSLLALTDATSQVSADDIALLGQQEEGDGRHGGGDGDERQPGPDFLPEWERWKIQYAPESKEKYFEILDHFDVDLAAVSQKSNRIDFLSDVNQDKPVVEVGTRASDKSNRLYFRNTKTKLRDWDTAKIKAGDVELQDTIVVQFYPEEARKMLLELESKNIADEGKELKDIKRTLFGCRKTEDGFEFFVEKIIYKQGSK